jgi:alginate O-acetyltransferase complex protein AlgJ
MAAMNPATPPQRIARTMDLWLSVIFVVLIFLPLADSTLELDPAPTLNEKRLLAKFPNFMPSLGGLRAFVSGLEAYYADHFGFRKTLLQLEHRWKGKFFHESAVSDVMIGRDGWLFLAGDHMIDDWRGARPLSPQELKSWQILLERRRDWLAQRGIKYLFVVAPNKETIYPEYLPEWMSRVRPTTRLDQFVDHMKAHSTVEILDLRPALLQAKQTARIYLKTDTHWNLYGAFIGYQNLIRALCQQLPGLGEPLPLSAFNIRYFQTKGGDLSTMLGQEQLLPEKDFVELLPRPPLRPIEFQTDTNILQKKWTLGTLPVYSENPAQKYKALFFRDSFAEFLRPYLAHSFRRSVYLWLRTWDAQVIAREQPDVVVDQFVERGFNDCDAKSILEAEVLP